MRRTAFLGWQMLQSRGQRMPSFGEYLDMLGLGERTPEEEIDVDAVLADARKIRDADKKRGGQV